MEHNILGVRLRQERRRQDLSQHELGERAGVNFTTISRVETGDYRQVSARVVCSLATALGVSLDWLYGRKENSRV